MPGDGTAEVEILVSDSCSGCQAKSVCSAGKTETKVIIAKCDTPLFPGDIVTVEMPLSQGFQALLIGYVVPFIVLITTFIIASFTGTGELASALLSFAAIGIYYLAVWLFRGRINEKYEFTIKV